MISFLFLDMRELSYLDLNSSVSWLLMPWLLASPGHRHPWYWLCGIGEFLSYKRKDFHYLYHVRYIYMFRKMACKELIVLYCNVLHCTACLTRGRISITYTMSDTLSVQLINLARKELIVLYRNVLHCTVALCSHDVFYENPNNFLAFSLCTCTYVPSW